MMEQPVEGFAQHSSVAGVTLADHVASSIELKRPKPFSQAWMEQRSPQYQIKHRVGTGLFIVSALHHQLHDDEIAALSRFRMEQFINAGYYDPGIIERFQITGDPVMTDVQPDDFHTFVTTMDGEIICYMCLESPLDGARVTRLGDAHRATDPGAKLRDQKRPLFPVECSYGSLLYAQHPGIGPLPIAAVREISVLVRNMDMPRSIVTDIALVETIVAAALYVMDPVSLVEAVLGSIAPEARRVLYNLGTPMLYAPFAPIVGDNLSGSASGYPSVWTSESHDTRFWPFVLASADLRLEQDYFTTLDFALSQHQAPNTIWGFVRTLQRQRPTRVSRYHEAPKETGGVYWTSQVTHERVEREQKRLQAQA